LLWNVGKMLGGIAALIVAGGDESAIYGNFWPV